MPVLELASKSISDVISSSLISSPYRNISNIDTLAIDAEDSVLQLVMLLDRLDADYVTVTNPDEGNIVSILGYLDILNLLYIATQQQPQLFIHNVQDVLTARNLHNNSNNNSNNLLITAPKTAKLNDVLQVMTDRNLTAIPIVDEVTNQVLGIYHKSDVTFIVRAADPDAVLANLVNMTVGDALLASQQQYQQSVAPELVTKVYTLVKIKPQDNLSTAIREMSTARITLAVCVNDSGFCIGIITIKDILKHFFPRNKNS
jgi:CBS domain-containing protein